MKKLLCPSMMCCDIGNLRQEIANLEQADIDIFHIDVMDGHYVSNLGIGFQEIDYISKAAERWIDVHLMVSNPNQYINQLTDIGVNIIYIHPETTYHPIRTLEEIRSKGAKAGIAISPNLAVEQVIELLPYVDYLLIMTVSPGFAGQSYLNSVDCKIERLLTMGKDNNYKVVLDGALDYETIKAKAELGVDGFVLGTSVLFGKEQTYKQIIKELRS